MFSLFLQASFSRKLGRGSTRENLGVSNTFIVVHHIQHLQWLSSDVLLFSFLLQAAGEGNLTSCVTSGDKVEELCYTGLVMTRSLHAVCPECFRVACCLGGSLLLLHAWLSSEHLLRGADVLSACGHVKFTTRKRWDTWWLRTPACPDRYSVAVGNP